ncbi:hypothetical protein [Flavisolibacter nicotianae]|uniref:hypothetical protein n=1 Tax=Flavisolibacter nicotianae TaxID=2364882 RepID=UPI0013C425FF|nr:hypothetical protein [Flavisolibacter nicotianae]
MKSISLHFATKSQLLEFLVMAGDIRCTVDLQNLMLTSFDSELDLLPVMDQYLSAVAG